jgi:tetratricopeptide (TPR) repeat protein
MTLLSRPAAIVMLAMLGGTAAVSGCSIPRVVVPHDPLTAEEHVTLGEAYRVKGLREAAEKEFQTALQRHPEYVPALVSLGNLSFEAGAAPAAEGYYRRALSQDARHPQANNNLAMVYVSQGERLAEAEQLARTALQGPPGLRPYVLDTLITLYLKQGRLEEARNALDEAERDIPSHDAALRHRFQQVRAELTGRPPHP